MLRTFQNNPTRGGPAVLLRAVPTGEREARIWAWGGTLEPTTLRSPFPTPVKLRHAPLHHACGCDPDFVDFGSEQLRAGSRVSAVAPAPESRHNAPVAADAE